MNIGILGLQGDYSAHGKTLEQIGVKAEIVRKPKYLDRLDGLIIPGGESTTLIRLIDAYNFWDPLRLFAENGNPIFGTCAGMILLANDITSPPQKGLGLIDITVERNSYGRQIDSFEGRGLVSFSGTTREIPMVFIRAPRITRVGENVSSLAYYRDDCVMVQNRNILVTSFHPELTDDFTVHEHFVRIVKS